ncbi:MAG: SGNH/GDSL hydrolase family protein, partial [Kiritimatiellae bacterium]|nr:SGNH/GDSL hydrolase family protein [Kiritimatiellia bacterium]
TGKRPVKDPFRVTVPTADIDWSGFDKALDENGEDVRRVIVPFNASDTNNTRRVLINSPFDDDGRHGRPGCNFGSAASPRITLRWTPMDCLQLTNRYDGVIPNGWSVDADDVGGWPLGFYVDPQKWKNDFVISCEEWNGGNGDVAMDSIHGRIVDVDLDVDANYDGIINEDDEPLEETQGGLVGGELVPIRLRVLPPGLPGKVSLVVTSDVARVKLWKDGNRTEEVELRKTWNAGETVPSILYVEGIAPSAAMRDIKMTLLYDENPDGQSSPLLKCEDCVKFTSNKAQMIGYAAWRGTDGKAVPDEEKYNPGFLVTVQTNGHLSAKVKFKGLPNVGLLRYYRFSKAGLVLANGQATTTAEVAIPQDDDFDLTLDMTDPSNWGDDSYVDVEYILRDAQGNLFDQDKCRLLRPYVVAVGDSLTYGFMRDNHGAYITPNWGWTSVSYPTASEWNSIPIPPYAAPPYNVMPDRTSVLYQGYRGYLSQSLSGFTWLGFDTNGHGPKHCGLPGAKIHETFTHATFQSTLAMQNSFLIIVMMAGANDAINETNSVTIKTQWENDANMISTSRMNGGRTLILALKVPQISSRYGGSRHTTIANNITQLNGKISSWSAPAGCRFVISSIVETGGIPHDDNDDGLHFLSTGYATMSAIIFSALETGLKLCDSAKVGN